MRARRPEKLRLVGQATKGTLLVSGLLVIWLCGAAAAAGVLSAAGIYRDAADSVVLIFGLGEGSSGNSGTGSILTRGGLVLTNDHVIAHAGSGQPFSKLVVYFKPHPISGDNARDLSQPYLAQVVARDRALDLALIRVQSPPSDLRPLAVGDSEEVEIGEDVAAIGHPGGGGLWTLTTGTISSKRRDQARDIFQTDAAINPGNSGGPLLDAYARLVGVNTFVRRVNEQGLPLEGLNYSLRSAAALRWVNAQVETRIAMVPRGSDRPLVQPLPLKRPSVVSSSAALSEPLPPQRVPARGVEAAPIPASPVSPSAVPPATSPSVIQPEMREFTASDGTRMYGVPNRENDLSASLRRVREAYSALSSRRDESVEEMERLFEEYDNF